MCIALCLVGLGFAVYLTYAHYTSPTVLACPDTGVVNCAKVTTSSEAMLFGVIPVAVTGVPYFVVMLLLCLPGTWRPGPRAATWRWARIAGAGIGMAMVCYLVYVEFVVLRAICLYCTVVHVVTFLLLAAVLAADALATTVED
ncbi:hypothetical protein GCM10027569_10300 [Flindersiella endophytica]